VCDGLVIQGVKGDTWAVSISSPPRPDLEAHAASLRLPLATLVEELRSILGARLVAYLGGVKETRAVREWAQGSREIQDPRTQQRLRLAYQVGRLITLRDSPGVAQAWFQGLNPDLEDRSPAWLLREGDIADVGPRLLAAARTFASTG
jgi:hypothetical protein